MFAWGLKGERTEASIPGGLDIQEFDTEQRGPEQDQKLCP